MKAITINYLIFILSIILTNFSSGQTLCSGEPIVLSEDADCDYTPYVLVFEDNFDGNKLDLSKWQIQPWGQGALYGNGGRTKEYNSLNNIIVSNGTCKIVAKKETITKRAISYLPDNQILADGLPNLRTFHYTSSNIWTKYKFGYGKYEIRCKLPKGKGFWPAFWMYGVGSNGISNEIDVFEFWDNNTHKHHMTVHYDHEKCGDKYNGPDYSDKMHTFTVVWNNYKIEWYVDNKLKWRTTKFNTLLGQNVDCGGLKSFHEYLLNNIFPKYPMNIIVNVAIQKGPYAPDNGTIFPNSMEIDYIKYYKREPILNEVNLSSWLPVNNLYNYIIGSNVIIGGNFTIQNNQQLKISAKNQIKLLPGFEAKKGCFFIANINPTLAYQAIKENNKNNVGSKKMLSNSALEVKYNTKTQLNEEVNIKVYPNPNHNDLVVDFKNVEIGVYEIYLMDENGKIVYKTNPINENKIEINMKNFSKGNYVLTILDKEKKKAYIHQIIHQ